MSNGPLILARGMTIVPVGNVQEQLQYLGFPLMYVDNIFGSRTEAACKQFQSSVGLPPTGVVDPETWRRMFDGSPLSGEFLPPMPQQETEAADQEAGGEVPGEETTVKKEQDASIETQAGADPPRIHIVLSEHRLYLYEDSRLVRSYPVAIGKPATPTPVGTFRILNKQLNPGGAFGTRWMAFTERGHGIHGTNQPFSIGNSVSNGCVRMLNADVEDLFPRIPVGTPVIIESGAVIPPGGVYVVQPGDTLFTIALRFNTTVEALKAANNLTSNIIYPGQRLNISQAVPPGPSTGYTIYTVRAGDSLFLIAQRFGTTVDAIIRANNLTSPTIFPGQRLRIPSPGPTPSPPEPPEGRPYTVQPGDTLFLLARRFGTTVEAIMRANNLTSTTILVGQRLIIPFAPTTGREYIVQPGDTLFLIAQRFGTSIQAIVEANNLVNANIFPGQRLIIPGA